MAKDPSKRRADRAARIPNTFCSNDRSDPATATVLPEGYIRPGTSWTGEQACAAACDDDPECIACKMPSRVDRTQTVSL